MEDFVVDRRFLLDYGIKSVCSVEIPEDSNWEKNDDIIKSREKNIKVFQIGFNKCGTRTLCSLFSRSKLPCLHLQLHTEYNCFNTWNVDSHPHSLQTGTLNFWDMIPHYIMFSDFGIVPKSDVNGLYLPNYLSLDLYNETNIDTKNSHNNDFLNGKYNFDESKFWYKQFEERFNQTSLYVLNIRPVHNWLKSRSVHANDMKQKLIERVQRIYKFHYNEIEILIMWKNLWYAYICNVIHYFNSINGKDRLLIYDIESDDPNIIFTFFENYDFKIKHQYSQHGKSDTQHRHIHYNAKILEWIEKEKAKWPWLNENNEKKAIEAICQVTDL